MKQFSVIVMVFVLSLPVIGQTERLPEILIPSEDSQTEAKRLDAQVFRMLPRGMFKELSNLRTDEGSPLGIRESGAFYSFTTRLHSYNKTPQILLSQGEFRVGFAGADYGMMADIGYFPLSELDATIPELVFMTGYRPPKYEKEIRMESFHNRRIDGVLYRRGIPATQGHTYLLRTINFDQADILVAFKVFKMEDDGSVTILWKKLADFGKPVMFSVPDDEIKASIDRIIAAKGIHGLVVDVKDNILIYRSIVKSDEMTKFYAALRENNIRYRGGTTLSDQFRDRCLYYTPSRSRVRLFRKDRGGRLPSVTLLGWFSAKH